MTENELFATFVDALGAARDHVIVIGGWAFRLFGLHPLATRQPAVIITNDLDVMFSSRSASGLLGRLERAGFMPRFKSGDEQPPVTEYVHPSLSGAPLEFLVAEKRGRKLSPPTLEIDGVNAVTLRGLEPLSAQPWQVEVSDATGFPVRARVAVHIPNPVAFVLHKLLVSRQRKDRLKREKDVLYAFDTIVLFAGRDRELAACLPAVSKTLTRTMRKSLRELSRTFQAPTDVVRGAARIAAAAGRPAAPFPEQISATLAAALVRFGF